MKSFRVIVLLCTFLMAIGAFAYQGSMPPAQTPATTASQNPEHPGATPPYAPPQTQPGTPQTPDAQTPQSEPAQAPPAARSSASNADAQVNSLTSALNLTPDQQSKIKAILEDQHQQVVGLVNDNSMAQDAKVQKVHAIRQSTIEKVRSTLTSDEQKSKFDSMIQTQNQRIQQREQQEQQPNTPAPK
jgi:hypothetical protein